MSSFTPMFRFLECCLIYHVWVVDDQVKRCKEGGYNHRGKETNDDYHGKLCWKIQNSLYLTYTYVKGNHQQRVFNDIKVVKLNFDQSCQSPEENLEPLMSSDEVNHYAHFGKFYHFVC